MPPSKRKREKDPDDEVEDQVLEVDPSTTKSTRAAALAAYTGNGADLVKTLHSASLDALRAGLTELRTLTGKNSYNEKLSPSDKRIRLAQEFCQAGGVGQSNQKNGRGILNAWDIIDSQEQISVLPIALFSLSNIISLLGSHQPTHDLADDIIQNLLPFETSSQEISLAYIKSNIYWTRLQTYLANASSGGKNDASSHKGKSNQSQGSQEIVTLATLRLLFEMTTFAGGKYAKSVFDHMNWTMKSLPRLSSMRRRVKGSKKVSTTSKQKNTVTLDRPDIRTLWILFQLSFLCTPEGFAQPVSLQVAALSLGKEFLPAILKGLANDPAQIVVHILMALHDGLVSDAAASKLPRSKVAGFFSEWACKELLALYDREEDLITVAATGERHSIADVLHHFMLALCTHPGRGVCYIDQGWYGRSRSNLDEGDDLQDEEAASRSSNVFNKILLGLLKSLSPTRSSKQAELTLRILSASQELIGPYFTATTGSLSSASLEPRGMSIAWLSTAAFMGRALAIPLPDSSSKWKASPPSVQQCLDSILPISLSKATLSRGISHKDKLTRHGALILLSRLLDRLRRFKDLCQKMRFAETDDEDDGENQTDDEEDYSEESKEDAILRGEYTSSNKVQRPWIKLGYEVTEEAKQRIPDLSSILSSVEGLFSPSTSKMDDGKKSENGDGPKSTHSLMVVETALRSARLHYDVFSEASNVDLNKLLSKGALVVTLQSKDQVESTEKEGNQRLSSVCQLHAMKLLTCFAERNGGGIDFFQGSKESTAFRQLLQIATSPSLDQVVQASRELIKAGIIETILFEHNQQEWDIWQYALDKSSNKLLDFFDECVQRCLKTPYRYIEIARAASTEEDNIPCVGPIYFTMMEQYSIRLQSGLLLDDDDKLAFWDFVSHFLPALSTLFDNEFPSWHLLKLTAQDGLEPLRIGRLPNSNGEEEVRNISEETCKKLFDTFKRTVYGCCKMAATSLRSKDFQYPEKRLETALTDFKTINYTLSLASTSQSKSAIRPTDVIGEITAETLLGELNIDWDSLLSSPVETRMMLTYCRNALLYDTAPVKKIKEVLQATLDHGDLEIVDIVSILFNGDWTRHCIDKSEHMAMLLQVIAEAPLDFDNVNDKSNVEEIFSKHPFQYLLKEWGEAKMQKELGDMRQDVGLPRTIGHAMIQLSPLLSTSTKANIIQEEFDFKLFCAAASGFEPYLRRLPEVLAKNLIPVIYESQDVKVVCTGLLLLKEMSSDDVGYADNLAVGDPNVAKTSLYWLLRRSDLANYDDVLCSVLSRSNYCCSHLWSGLICNHNMLDILTQIPLSLARAATTIDNLLPSPIREAEGIDEKIVERCISKIFESDQKLALSLAQVCLKISHAAGLPSFKLDGYLEKSLPKRPMDFFKPSVLFFAAGLVQNQPLCWLQSQFLNLVMDNALLWLVRRFAEDKEESSETIEGVEAFLKLLQICKKLPHDTSTLLKSHFAEPVLWAIIANRLDSKLHLKLMRYMTCSATFKHAIWERLVADLLKSRDITTDGERSKEVVAIIHEAVQVDDKLCNGDVIASLVKLYHGTLTKADRQLMTVFHKHEANNKQSVLSQLHHWQAGQTQALGKIDLGILSRLDPAKIHETSLKFPRSRSFNNLITSGYADDVDDVTLQEAVYDPLLILALVGALLAGEEPLSGLQWLELVRTNALGVVICCLSSKWPEVRSLAITILSSVYSKVATADFQEKDHLLLIIDFTRNSYKPEDVGDTSSPSSLPLTTTLFVAHSLRSLGIPSLYLYPLVSRFLLQRPTPDPTDVPLLYAFFYSSSAQSSTAKSEKVFMLRFLLNCLKFGGKVEWNIMKRRHVWDSICSLYAAENNDSNIGRIIQEIFVVVSQRSDLAFRVVVCHAWLNYISQVQAIESEENQQKSRKFWTYCVANLLESIDLDRLQDSLGSSCFTPFIALLDSGLQSDDESPDLTYYFDLLRANECLAKHGVKVDEGVILSYINHLGPGWTFRAFQNNLLPRNDSDTQDKLTLQCRAKIRSIKECLSRKPPSRNKQNQNSKWISGIHNILRMGPPQSTSPSDAPSLSQLFDMIPADTNRTSGWVSGLFNTSNVPTPPAATTTGENNGSSGWISGIHNILRFGPRRPQAEAEVTAVATRAVAAEAEAEEEVSLPDHLYLHTPYDSDTRPRSAWASSLSNILP